MAAAAIKTYADTQLKNIAEKIAKLEGDKVEVEAKRARLASSCRKWMQAKYNAR
jgi:hypothetical protein